MCRPFVRRNALRLPARRFNFRALPVAFTMMFGWPAVASAEDVAVTTNGVISVAGLPPVYNGQYVLQTTDFGFLWLDTVALQGGLVQAESNCAPGMPPSHSNIYVLGDCNGVGTIASSGSTVLVRQFNSQCGTAATGSCDGPLISGPSRLTFGLGGTWPYLGNQGEIPDSTQTADPEGRTWTAEPVDFTGRNFNWHSSEVPDSGVPVTDSGSSVDGSAPGSDSGPGADGGAVGPDAGIASGCGCHQAPSGSAGGALVGFGALLGVLCSRTRRRARCSSGSS